MLNQRRQTVGVFPSYEAAERAFDRLILAGFPIAKTFLVGKSFSAEADGAIEQTDLADQMVSSPHPGAIFGTPLGLKKGIVLGNLLGTNAGLILALAILALPGVGEVMLVSSLLFMLLSSGLFTAVGGLIGAMIGLNVTEQQAKRYSQQVAQGKYLLIVDGTTSEVACAEQILKKLRML